jgi:hypothetical protein
MEGQKMSSENMELWDKVCTTDKAFTKAVSFGRKFTAIDPTYQLMEATKLWGPYGDKWGLQQASIHVVDVKCVSKDKNTKKLDEQWVETSAIMTAEFYYPNGSFPILVDAPLKPGEDTAKKLQTSAISKSLSKLGFNADVFLGKFDDSQYLKELDARQQRGSEAIDRLTGMIELIPSVDKIEQCVAKAEALFKSKQITGAAFDGLIELIESRRAVLIDTEVSPIPPE